MRRRRVAVVLAVVMVGYACVLARLVRLQVTEAEMWQWESERSGAQFVSEPFRRGWILDRHGQPLACTEQVFDLTFTYRDWRRGTVAGQVALANWTLFDAPPSVSAACAHWQRGLDRLGDVTVGQIAALEPRQRRVDVCFYIGALLGDEVEDGLLDALAQEQLPAALRVAELSGHAEGLQRAHQRGAREQSARARLADLARLGDAELLEGMEAAVRRSAERVARAQADLPAGRAEVPDPTDEPAERDVRQEYRRQQQLAAAFDAELSTLAERVPYDVQTLVAIRGRELAGFDVRTEQRRVYPLDVAEIAPLLVGRVGAPSPDDLEPAEANRVELANLASLHDLSADELDRYEELAVAVRELDYRGDEERGVLGVEAAFEQVLRGRRGWVAVRVDDNRPLREERLPRRGLDVVLTLDVALQQACQDSLDAVFAQAPDVPGNKASHWTGAVVLLDPRSGHVLAAASGPRPSRRELTEEYGRLLMDDPWVKVRQRAIDPGRTGNLAPPGSTFKPASALAALEAGLIDARTRFQCSGRYDVGDRSMGCLGNHGEIDLVEAMARSCNIYFYNVGGRLGVQPLSAMADALGYGRRSGLVAWNESLRTLGVPVSDGVHEAHPRLGPGPYTRTDGMRLAIGQAPLDDVTPLQVASMMGAVGTGVLVPPQLVASVEGYGDVPSRPGVPVPASAAHLALVRRSMEAVVDLPVGTARGLYESHPELAPHVAAKTGTAEVDGRPDHAWLAGYLPRESPRLAFAVLIEECGLHGSEAALPVLAEILSKPAVAAFLEAEILPGSDEALR